MIKILISLARGILDKTNELDGEEEVKGYVLEEVEDWLEKKLGVAE
jgi:hypothetical protein